MISLQSHNQVLYHLTQLTSSVSPTSTPLPVKVSRGNESVIKIQDQICSSNFADVGKSSAQRSIENLKANDVVSKMFKLKRNDVWLILDKLSMKIVNENLEKNYKWKVSYLSRSSFAENKQMFPCAQLTEPIIIPAIYLSSKHHHRTLCALCVKDPFKYHIQTRSFKTQRNWKKEIEKDLSVTSRFKKLFGQFASTDTITRDGESLKYIFHDPKLSVLEKERLKCAFADGYQHGAQRQQIRTRFSTYKMFSSIAFGIVVVVGVLFAVTSGSMYRFSMGQRAEINPEMIHVTFNDVKGVEEAKQELRDVVEFLKNPEKFSALGGKLPKGVLLVGPPGTGKTLLARAVAGEAGVPFFHAAGPEFDEVLVGQGARRIRDLFKAAKEKAPAVIFIDEIDSVGATRTNSVLHPYANQTINQLLSEMDGFHQNEGVIVLGATNRREDLDKALMRPGRFDVQIVIHRPDYLGRKEILDLYLSRVLTRDVDTEYLARCTTGFTGADLENMINQAALKAAINDADYVTMTHLEYARDKVLMGPEIKRRINDEEGNKITAYHEAGHALVTYYTKDSPPIHKVTIVPRGQSLGHTSYIPDKDNYHVTKSQLLASMDGMMGGRAAEELIFGPDKITTGASSDLENATSVAEKMVKHFGMSEKVGFRIHTDSKRSDYGPGTNELIDNEVKRLLQESYERAKAILKSHAKQHKQLADALLKYETLNAEDVRAIVNGKNTRTETLNNQPTITEPTKNVL